MFAVYVLQTTTTASVRSYVGVTTDLARRLTQHNGAIAGGAKATRAGRPWVVAFATPHRYDRPNALRLEAQTKRRRGLHARVAYLTSKEQLRNPPPHRHPLDERTRPPTNDQSIEAAHQPS